jgi:hypothetical protein
MDLWTAVVQLIVTPAVTVAVIAYGIRNLFQQLLKRFPLSLSAG